MEIIHYIKSGEFTFCSRCGHICRLGKENFMCKKCTSDLFPRNGLSELEIKEKCLFIRVEQEISDIIIGYRKELAELRNYTECSLTS